VDLAEGTADAAGRVELFLGPMTQAELRYDIAARLTGVSTEV
jgi:hypothetical protein